MSYTKINLISQIPKNLKEAAFYVESKIKKAGFEAYLVGGCVRDLLLKKKFQTWISLQMPLPKKS